MNQKHMLAAAFMFCLAAVPTRAESGWTLQQCIDYALQNNIELKQKKLSSASSEVDLKTSKAALWPTLSFSTNQSGTWRPYAGSTVSLTNGTMTTSGSTTTYNGSYGLNANWTVWNGGKNLKNVKRDKMTKQMADLETEETANSIQQQIAQLYIQILYQKEAIKVSRETVKTSEMQRDRAAEMVKVGSLAQVDLAQLEAQVTQDQYTLVSAETQLADYLLQLKQLLEIHDDTPFDVATPATSDAGALASIPSKSSVYQASLTNRPEILRGKLNIEASKMDIDIARTGYYPTVSLTAGMGSNNSSGQHGMNFGNQLKNNWSNTIGFTISMPIFDGRQTKSAIQKAKLAAETSTLSLQSAQKELYSQIESYYLGATNSQQQYRYAKTNVESMQKSYDLVSEQFRLGLKNIVELTTGKDNLLQAEQQRLQTKYNTLYNLAMLKFYAGDPLQL